MTDKHTKLTKTLLIFILSTGVLCSAPAYVAAAVIIADNVSENFVTEQDTGLLWQRNEADPMSWEDAINYCESLKISEYSKWKLPDVKELQSLINYGTTKPATDVQKYPETHLSDYWTSTTYVSSKYSYCVNFTTGATGYCNKSQKKYVRCVKRTDKK